MKPTDGMTPTASAKLDNYIHINFEDVNEMTDAEQHAMELAATHSTLNSMRLT